MKTVVFLLLIAVVFAQRGVSPVRQFTHEEDVDEMQLFLSGFKLPNCTRLLHMAGNVAQIVSGVANVASDIGEGAGRIVDSFARLDPSGVTGIVAGVIGGVSQIIRGVSNGAAMASDELAAAGDNVGIWCSEHVSTLPTIKTRYCSNMKGKLCCWCYKETTEAKTETKTKAKAETKNKAK